MKETDTMNRNNNRTFPEDPHDAASPVTRTLDVADGQAMIAGPADSQAFDAEYHEGLQDAPFYDADAINPDHPLGHEHAILAKTDIAIQRVINRCGNDAELQRDIVKDGKARFTALEQRKLQVESDLPLATAAAQKALDENNDIPDLDARTTPPAELNRAARRQIYRVDVLYPGIRSTLAYTAFGLAEVVVNTISFLILRESTAMTTSLAISVSLALIGAFVFAAKAKSIGLAAGLLVAAAGTILGTSAMRYSYASSRVAAALAKSEMPPMEAWLVGGLAMFSIFTAVMFGMLAFAETKDTTAARIREVRAKRQHVHALETELVDLAGQVTATTQTLRNAEMVFPRLRLQAETQIRAEAGRVITRLASYSRGLAHGLGTPESTARLDRRIESAIPAVREHVKTLVTDAIARLQTATVLDLDTGRGDPTAKGQPAEMDGHARIADLAGADTAPGSDLDTLPGHPIAEWSAA
jgi:hypothetical protein